MVQSVEIKLIDYPCQGRATHGNLALEMTKAAYNRRVSSEAILASYARTQSVWQTGKEVGLCGQSVHERLVALRIPRTHPLWTQKEDAVLKREYLVFRDAGRLKDLADTLGRTVPFMCRQARRLGLTNPAHKKKYLACWKYMEEEKARTIFEDFKDSSLGLRRYCAKKGYDDLGFSRTMKKFFSDEYEHVIELKVPKEGMYRRGRRFEYKVRDHLRGLGYFVTRSPASRSPIDLVAIKAGSQLLVQCKVGGYMGPDEWNAVYDLATSIAATPILAEYKARQTPLYWILTGRKDGSKKGQPRKEWADKPGIEIGIWRAQ